MSLTIIIPTPLRKLTANHDTVEVEAETIRDVINRLDDRYPGFRSRVCDDTGEEIPRGRLEAVPEAVRTVEAQQRFERERRPPA